MKKSTLFGILCLAAGAAAGLSTVHRASADSHCRAIHARGEDSITQDGCQSPVGLCTAGAVRGSGLDGAFNATVMNLAPGATPGTSSIDAYDTIATDRGTLALHLSGVFDPVHGTVTFIGQDLSGTGRFEGVSGRLYFNGAATAEGSFASDITGEMCFPDGAGDDD